jgi:hypothetical protein
VKILATGRKSALDRYVTAVWCGTMQSSDVVRVFRKVSEENLALSERPDKLINSTIRVSNFLKDMDPTTMSFGIKSELKSSPDLSFGS